MRNNRQACSLLGHICFGICAWSSTLSTIFIFQMQKDKEGLTRSNHLRLAGSSHFRLILINHFQKNFTSLHFNDFLLKYFLEIIQSPINVVIMLYVGMYFVISRGFQYLLIQTKSLFLLAQGSRVRFGQILNKFLHTCSKIYFCS